MARHDTILSAADPKENAQTQRQVRATLWLLGLAALCTVAAIGFAIQSGTYWLGFTMGGLLLLNALFARWLHGLAIQARRAEHGNRVERDVGSRAPGTGTANIHFVRARDTAGLQRRKEVSVNGSVAGRLKRGQECELAVEAGTYSVVAQMD